MSESQREPTFALNEEELKALLSPLEYKVLREKVFVSKNIMLILL
jgi:hypothetical protein